MNILALDISAARTGLAFGDGSGPPVLRSHSFSADVPGETLWMYQRWLSTRLNEYQPDAVIMEAANMAMNAGSSADRARMAVELSGCTRAVVYGRTKMRTHDVMDSSWRKAFLGRGRFAKEQDPETGQKISGAKVAKREALALCKRLKWECLGEDDRADAAGVWFFAHKTIPGGNAKGVSDMLAKVR